MKALVYTAPKTLIYQEEIEPVSNADEVLVKVEAASICGSDMHAFLGHDERRVPPLTLGHEIAGTIAEGEHKGKSVVVNPLISCHNCSYCLEGRANLCPTRTMLGMSREGGFADFVSSPLQNLIFTHDLSPNKAVLAEPTATVIHALRLVQKTLWRPLSEAKTLVIGGGAIGMLSALCLQAFGVQTLTLSETSALRRKNYQSMPGIELHDPTTAKLNENSFDLILDVVGIAATRKTSLETIKPGGLIMHIGLGQASGDIDARKLTLGEISLLGSYAYNMIDMQQALEFIKRGQLGNLDWIEVRPLSEGQKAFEDLLAGEVESPKIVLVPNQIIKI